MYFKNYSKTSEWIETLLKYVCYAGEVTVLKNSVCDPVYDQSPSGTRITSFSRFFDGQTIPTQIRMYYTAKYEFNDTDNIYVPTTHT